MPNPSVAVLTPTIPGRELLLRRCVESVKAQTLPVVHLTYRDDNGEGPATCRNSLAQQTDIDYLAFLDDDDTADPTWIERLLELKSDVAYSSWHVAGCAPPQVLRARDLSVPSLEELASENRIPVTALVRRSAFLAVGGFRTDARDEDHRLWIDLMAEGYSFARCPERLWTYSFGDPNQRTFRPRQRSRRRPATGDENSAIRYLLRSRIANRLRASWIDSRSDSEI